MKKYRTDNLGIEIGVVECINETGKMCTIIQLWNTRRVEHKVLKMTGYTQYHDSWADAHAFLIERAERKVRSAADALDDAQKDLRQIEAMKEPT